MDSEQLKKAAPWIAAGAAAVIVGIALAFGARRSWIDDPPAAATPEPEPVEPPRPRAAKQLDDQGFVNRDELTVDLDDDKTPITAAPVLEDAKA